MLPSFQKISIAPRSPVPFTLIKGNWSHVFTESGFRDFPCSPPSDITFPMTASPAKYNQVLS